MASKHVFPDNLIYLLNHLKPTSHFLKAKQWDSRLIVVAYKIQLCALKLYLVRFILFFEANPPTFLEPSRAYYDTRLLHFSTGSDHRLGTKCSHYISASFLI